MADKAKSPKVMTPTFRASFTHVFKPHKASADAEPKFSLAMIFDAADPGLAALKKAAIDAAVQKYGVTTDGKPNVPAGFKWPFRKGEEKVQYDGYGPGKVFCSASTKQPPGLVDQKRVPILDEREFYPGCYARATVNAFVYDQKGNRGVAFGLNNIQKVRDGEPLGRISAEKEFDEVPDSGSTTGVAAPAAADNDPMFS